MKVTIHIEETDTNGDVMRKTFPNMEFSFGKQDNDRNVVYMDIYPLCKKDAWWDKPYGETYHSW